MFHLTDRTVFVKPKSRCRSNAALSKYTTANASQIKQQEQTARSKSFDFGEGNVDGSSKEFRCSKDNYVFVGNIKRTMDAKHLRDTFKR